MPPPVVKATPAAATAGSPPRPPPVDWARLRSKFPPVEKTPEAQRKRLEVFKLFDPNNNGYLSLAEIDKGCRDVLGLYEVFDCKPVIMRAYQAARGANNVRSSKAASAAARKHGEDFVERSEFRLLIVYLRQYFELWQMFDEIDSSDDRRVSVEEFKQALPRLEAWGVKVKDPVATFKSIDTDGGGMILFDEFADWALKLGLDLEDDDDFDDPALATLRGQTPPPQSASPRPSGASNASKPSTLSATPPVAPRDKSPAARSKSPLAPTAATAGSPPRPPPVDWARLRSKFPPVEKTPEAQRKRLEVFKLFDPNNNGYLSLAEIDKGCRDVLGLYEVFDCKPVIMRAYQAARGANNVRSSKAASAAARKHGEDFVERSEFRLLIVYLRQYFELWQMFDEIDSSDDRRVSVEEFKQALPRLEAWGVKVKDPVATFKSIDTDGGGMILFDEFADWALKLGLDLEDDDDFDDPALATLRGQTQAKAAPK